MNKKIVVTGLVLLVIAIILGALGAHGLKELINPEKLASFEVGVRYEIYCGMLLLIIGLNADKFSFSLKWMSNLILMGVFLFSGSVYLLSMQELTTVNLKFLGPITPIGGSLMIAGCIVWIVQILRKQS